MAAAAALLLLGFAAWVRLPHGARTLDHLELPILALWLSTAGLVAGLVWLLEHPPGTGWSPVTASLTLAATAPLSVVPVVMPGVAGGAARAALVLAALAVLPLAWTLGDRSADPRIRGLLHGLSVVCVAAAVLLVASPAIGPERVDGYLGTAIHQLDPWGLRWLLLAVATLVPALAAAWAVFRSAPDRPSPRDGDVVTAVVLVGAGILPIVTGLALVSATIWPALVIPVAAALAMVALLGRVAIGPLARSAGTATLQRDLVVAAAEAERARLATVLHDGPLGDVALLIQRLDAAGDEANAALARSIADELRDAGNDLRLPILEDLGLGAALEWLVARDSPSASPIRLAVDETARPPRDVEAGAYRIAQEALRNALAHGAPPVQVTYEGRQGRIDLRVEDAGPGLGAGAEERAQQAGRMGLLVMRQRAEAMGGRLDVSSRVPVGTLVRLRWPAPPP